MWSKPERATRELLSGCCETGLSPPGLKWTARGGLAGKPAQKTIVAFVKILIFVPFKNYNKNILTWV